MFSLEFAFYYLSDAHQDCEKRKQISQRRQRKFALEIFFPRFERTALVKKDAN